MELPQLLIDVFRNAEKLEAIAVTMIDDGFDAATMRVLVSWQHTKQIWKKPKQPAPEVRASSEAWAWLCSGWCFDVQAVAEGAGVSAGVALEKLEMLRANRLIYPDGKMAKAMVAALRTHISQKLKGGKGKKGKGEGDEGGEPKQAQPGQPDRRGSN